MKSKYYWMFFGLIIFGLLFYIVLPFINILIYGTFLYYIARPLYMRLYKILNSKNLAAFFSLFIIVLPVIFISAYTINVASYELNFLFQKTNLIPKEYSDRILTSINDLVFDIEPANFIDLLQKHGDMLNTFISPILGVIDIIFKLFLVFSVSYYLLKDGGNLRVFILDNLKNHKYLMEKFFKSVDSSLHRVFFGNILTIILTALLGVFIFNLLNIVAPSGLYIPYPTLLGILCGLAVLIPGIGVKIVWIPIALYIGISAYLSGILFSEIWFIILFLILVNIVVDFTPDIILRPMISGRGLHSGALMFAYIFGIILFGFVGLFLGPMILVLSTSFVKVILPEIAPSQTR